MSLAFSMASAVKVLVTYSIASRSSSVFFVSSLIWSTLSSSFGRYLLLSKGMYSEKYLIIVWFSCWLKNSFDLPWVRRRTSFNASRKPVRWAYILSKTSSLAVALLNLFSLKKSTL